MRALIQRVSSASVAVDGEIVGVIGEGLVVLLGVGEEDGSEEARKLADKLSLAARQHGVVGRRQLVDAGLGSGAIDRRLLQRMLG